MRLVGRARPYLSVAVLTVCLAATSWLVYRLGFDEMVARYGPQPERLRDYTFPVWERESVSEHGFLAFLTSDGFVSGSAYSNFSTAYLLVMFVLYRVERFSGSLDMRTTAAYLEMWALVATVVLVLFRRFRTRFAGVHGLLPLAAVLCIATQPIFWISAAKFNVDNIFHFSMPLLVLAAYQIAYRRTRDVWFWAPLVAFAVFSPLGAVLAALFMCVKALGDPEAREDVVRPGIVLFGVGVAGYLQPILTSRLLGFESDNSGLLFRSGLDGDRESYTNPVQAVLDPFLERPVALIAVPAVFLMVRLVEARWRTGDIAFPADRTDRTFLQLLFSQYVLSVLLFPQSVSIHPYLYDHLLVAPILVWVALHVAAAASTRTWFTFWLFAFAGLAVYNLTQIAQAGHCADRCFFPG